MLCITFALIIYYQYRREAEYRAETFSSELSLIDNRILDAYERDVNLRTFLSFIQQYFRGSVYEDVRISVYTGDGTLYYSLGIPIPFDLGEVERHRVPHSGHEDSDQERLVGREEGEGLYFYSSTASDDGRVVIRTAMPYSEDVHDAIAIDSTVWIVILLCLLATLVVTYFSTRVLSRNIMLLRDFATRAATGGRFTGMDKFPRNELGDISREIITLYRERGTALEVIKKERKVAIHAIEEKARVTRQMSNNINHEIKTPVGIIRGYLESILSDPDMDDATRRRFLERTLQNVERLVALLNDVSTMTRLENGADMIATDRVDMHDLVYQIANDLEVNGLAGTMKFFYEIPMDTCVKGNYSLLQGMVCGLIRNSAIHSGGTEIHLNLISESERFYVFSFYDDGQGVSDEHIPHLFERFYRVDTGRSRKMGGTGLGLPIVKSTIVSMGGTVSVHNRSTRGLEFIFTLPKWTE